MQGYIFATPSLHNYLSLGADFFPKGEKYEPEVAKGEGGGVEGSNNSPNNSQLNHKLKKKKLSRFSIFLSCFPSSNIYQFSKYISLSE